MNKIYCQTMSSKISASSSSATAMLFFLFVCFLIPYELEVLHKIINLLCKVLHERAMQMTEKSRIQVEDKHKGSEHSSQNGGHV